MKIRVAGRDLYNLFMDFVKSSKVLFNFQTDGYWLYAQLLEEYTAMATIKVGSLDGDHSMTNASFWVTRAIGVLDKDKPVDITFSDAVMFLEQDNFSSTFVKEHEERRTYPDMSQVELKPAFANRLKYLTHSVISCTGLAKELSISDPDPVFSRGRFYADYRQTYFIDNMEYPEVCFAFSALRDFAFRLEEKATYAYLPEINSVYFKSGKYELWVPTINYNIDGSTISAIDRKMAECVKVTDLSFKEYADKMLILSSAYPKQRLSFLVGNGSFNMSISTNEVQCTIGDKMSSSLFGLNMTSAQVTVIAKLFKEDDTVECLRGGNCICLRSGEKNILIAGMIY